METKSEVDCPDCNEARGQCEVCWAMENTPEIFVMTPEQVKSAEAAADFCRKKGITPNLDSIY